MGYEKWAFVYYGDKKGRTLAANIPCGKSVDNVQNGKVKKQAHKHVI